MCGICGGFNLPEQALNRMMDAMTHRGPDGAGSCVRHPLSMGMRRLAVIDPAGSDQPIENEDGKVIGIGNGEIYNYQELREELKIHGHHFRTAGDMEVIVHGYEQWGNNCFQRLDGMFALAIMDVRSATPEFTLARDRMGIKPLYYSDLGSPQFSFASEVRALLQNGSVHRRVDETALWEYSGFQAPHVPRTMLRGVNMVPAGHFLKATQESNSAISQYYDLTTAISTNSQRWDEPPLRTAQKHLSHAIESHLHADVPLGIFLSGGLDSASIAALARAAGHSSNTFTVGFPHSTGSAQDERTAARLTAKHLHTDHTEVLVTEDDCLEHIENALAQMDHPTGDGINMFIVSQAAHRAGFKVAVSGLGADEIFGGYPTFLRAKRMAAPLARWRSSTSASVRRGVGRVVRYALPTTTMSTKIATILEHGDLPSAYSTFRQIFSTNSRLSIFNDRFIERIDTNADPYSELALAAMSISHSTHSFMASSLFECQGYMHDVLLRDADQMSMANGLEIRIPFLDRRLVEFVTGLPDATKQGSYGQKHLLKSLVSDMLPATVLTRPKTGFALPWDRWIRGPLHELCETRIKRLAQREWFDETAVNKMWLDFDRGVRTATWSRVWTLVALEEWFSRNGVG